MQLKPLEAVSVITQNLCIFYKRGLEHNIQIGNRHFGHTLQT